MITWLKNLDATQWTIFGIMFVFPAVAAVVRGLTGWW